MNKILRFLLIVIIPVFYGCGGTVFNESEEFSDLKWPSSKELVFSGEVSDTAGEFELVLNFRHVYGFNQSPFYISIETQEPNGKKTEKTYPIQVVKAKNEYYSECSGDYCDYEYVLEPSVKLQGIGEYKYVMKPLVEENLNMVMEVGLKLKRK